jgi:hypothetical protein
MPEKRNKHLLAVFRACSCSIEYVLTYKYTDSLVYFDACDASNDAFTQSYLAAEAADSAACAADTARGSDGASEVVRAVRHALNASDTADILQEISNDLSRLKELSALDLLSLPLWSSPIPELWQLLLIKFKQDALSLNADFDIWLDWYDDRLQGKPINIEQLQQWNKIIEENQKQDVALINAYLKHPVQKNDIQDLSNQDDLNKKPPRELDNEEYDNSALSYYEYDLEKLSKTSLDYGFLSIKDFENSKTLSVTKDEKTALIGCDDHARVYYINLREKNIETNYLGDEDIICMDVISNSRAIAFTYNGYAALLNLDRAEVIKQSQVLSKDVFDDVYIREIKYSSSQNIAFAITSKMLLAIDITALNLLSNVKLDFELFFVLPIPDTNFIAVSGSHNRLELFKFEQLVFTKVDSISCGEVYKSRYAAIAFDVKRQLLISTSEPLPASSKIGFLDTWEVSNEGLVHKSRLNINDSLWSLQCVDDYIIFSTDNSGVFIFNTQDNLLSNIPYAGGDILFKKINGNHYLLFYPKNKNGFTEDNGIYILEVNKEKLYLLQVDLDPLCKTLLTSDGTIIIVNDREIVLSNLFETKQATSEYDFKVSDFIFNQNEQSVLLKCKDNSFWKLSLEDNQWLGIELAESDEDWEFKDFLDNSILMSNWSEILILDCSETIVKKVISIEKSPRFEDARLLDFNHFLVLTNHYYPYSFESTPSVTDFINIYNFEGNSINSKNLGFQRLAKFISHNKILISGDENTIINIENDSTLSFDIRFILDGNKIAFSSNSKYCLYLSTSEMFCADLNSGGTRLWHIEDSILWSYKPFGYSRPLNAFLIFNEIEGKLLAVSIYNAEIINAYQLSIINRNCRTKNFKFWQIFSVDIKNW